MLTFQKSGRNDLTIPNGRTMPHADKIQVNQTRNLTANNNAQVARFGNDLELINLKIEALSRANYDDINNGLKTWFSSAEIDYSMNDFTMIENGESKTVRFWQGDFSMPATSGDTYEINVILKVE